MSDTPRSAEAQRIAELWGEPFAALADHPRIEFDGDAIVITLWKPIRVSGAEAPKLRIQEPTLGQLQTLDRVSGEMAQTQRLLMQVGGLTEKEAGTLGLRDIGVAGLVLAAFTGTARATGA